MLDLPVLKDWLHRDEPARYQKLMLVAASLGGGPTSVAKIRDQARYAGWRIPPSWNLSSIMERTKGLLINTPSGWELTEAGRKDLQSLGVPINTASNDTEKKIAEPTPSLTEHVGIHPEIQKRCERLYASGSYAEAVEKSFKIVRERLRNLTGYETGSEAFGKTKLHVNGAAAPHVDYDFNEGVKFLTMAIDKFRNEKSHTADGNIADPVRAQQYLMLSSLAMYLLDNAEVAP